MSEKQPIYILPENVSRTLGKDAQRNNILAAKIIADIVKTTLGPKGMDKMLVDSSGNIIVTNDDDKLCICQADQLLKNFILEIEPN